MKKKGKHIFIILIGLIPFFSCAQILNIDRAVIDDTVFHKFAFVSSLSISSDKQKKNVLDLGSNIEVDRFFKNNYVLLGIIRNDAVFSGKTAIQNEGQFHLRFRDMDKRKYSLEEFVQYQWNGAWGLEYRNLAGVNFRMKFLEKRKADLYAALGVFHEWEKWNWNGVKDQDVPVNATDRFSTKFRFNNYFKYSVKLSDIVDVSAITYVQFPLSGKFFQPRWYVDANLYLAASKHINFVVHWDHISDRARVVPIDDFYYSFSTGIQMNFNN
jgi:hypothetical protein